MEQRAMIELIYDDETMKVIARDSWISPRLSATFEKLAKAKVRRGIRYAYLGHSNDNDAGIDAQVWFDRR